ncbi:MAG: hypothetical protein P8077_02970, partial [Gammaproteobacteria bacterium]
MDLKIIDNAAKQAGETSVVNEQAEFGDTFEELNEAELFEEELIRGDEDGSEGGADGGANTDFGGGQSGESGGNSTSSSGQERLLDYWSARNEETGIEIQNNNNGSNHASNEAGFDEAGDWYDDAEDNRHEERQEELEAERVLARDEALDEGDADEDSDFLESIDNQSESLLEEALDGDTVVEYALNREHSTMDSDAGQGRSRGHIDLQESGQEAIPANDAGTGDPNSSWDQHENERFEEREIEIEQEQALEHDQRLEEIEAEDELSEEGGADGEMLLEDGDDYIGENSFGGGSSGDSGQGRSRGEYVAPEDSEEKAGNVEQKSKKSHVGVSGQTGADLREQIESQREQIESQDEAAADARARRDDSVESYLAEREELAQQERVQEHLTAIEQFQNNLQGLSQFAGQQGFMGSLAFVGFGGGFFGGVAPIPTMDRRGLIVEKPKEKENTKGVGKSQSKKSLDSAEHADSKDELQEDESESQLRGAEKALTHEDLVAVRREAFQERFGQWLAARDEEIGDEDDQQFIAQMLLEYHQYALQDDDGEARRISSHRCCLLGVGRPAGGHSGLPVYDSFGVGR